ncbi:methyltransferase domain-containing protein [Clostridium sp.]|uniref:class I SAM-dependent methyltransferase n=1 Tax=Clostridium sp. TaxID=1506 RepID=UPI003464AAE5
MNKYNEDIRELEITIDKLLNDNINYGLKSQLIKVRKEIDIIKKHNCKNESTKSKEKIQIGGGTRYFEEFFNIDINEPADLIHDVREGIPLEDNISNMIFCEHFLEHLDYPRSVYKFINECYRILKPNGKLIIGVPDGEQVIRAYVNNDVDYYNNTSKRWIEKKKCVITSYIDVVNYHFRDVNDSDEYTPHLWAYNYHKLICLLKEAGFSSASKWDIDLNLINAKRMDRTIYVIGIK